MKPNASPPATLSRSATTTTRSTLGLVLIGMTGIERWLAGYPQLYNRVGFVHRYEPLRPDELTLVLASRWPDLHLGDPGDQATVDAVAAITRYTHGNFRLVDRLLSHVTRVLEINHLSAVTSDVVDAARDVLIIGAP